MTIIEISPRNTWEHRRCIRRMTKGLKISYKRWEAATGLATDIAALVLMIGAPIAFVISFVGWWICV